MAQSCQRSRDGLLSRPLPLQLPCERLVQPWLLGEKTNAFLSLCQARVSQGRQHCHDSCTFLVLNTTFSTSHCAPRCGVGRWEEQPAPPSFPAPGRPGSHGWGRPGCGVLGERVRQNKTQWCLFASGGSTRRMNLIFVPRLISQINLYLSTTQEEQGGSLLRQLGKKWLFYQPEHGRALFRIVFL